MQAFERFLLFFRGLFRQRLRWDRVFRSRRCWCGREEGASNQEAGENEENLYAHETAWHQVLVKVVKNNEQDRETAQSLEC